MIPRACNRKPRLISRVVHVNSAPGSKRCRQVSDQPKKHEWRARVPKMSPNNFCISLTTILSPRAGPRRPAILSAASLSPLRSVPLARERQEQFDDILELVDGRVRVRKSHRAERVFRHLFGLCQRRDAFFLGELQHKKVRPRYNLTPQSRGDAPAPRGADGGRVYGRGAGWEYLEASRGLSTQRRNSKTFKRTFQNLAFVRPFEEIVLWLNR